VASGGFRPRPGGTGILPQFCFSPPISWPLMIFFATITQIFDFFVFLEFTKVGKFAASIERLKTKSASASGWLRPPDALTSYTRSLNLVPCARQRFINAAFERCNQR